MFTQPFKGAKYLLEGFGLLTRPGIKRFVVVPLAVNIALFSALIWFLAGQFKAFLQWLLSYLPDWLAWLDWLLWPVFAIVTAIVIFFTFSLVANLIAAPFNALLAQAVESNLRGRPATGGSQGMGALLQALKDLPSTILDELGKLAYYLRWAIPLLLLSLIPVLNLAAPLLWAVFSAWILAVEYSDYPLGNRGMRGPQQRETLRKKRMLSLGFGATTLVLTLTPIANFLIMPAAVAGATAMWVKEGTPGG